MSGPFRADPEPSPHRPINAYDLLDEDGDAILDNTTYAHAIRLAEVLNAWVVEHDAELRNQIADDILQLADTLWNRSSTRYAGWEQIVALVRGREGRPVTSRILAEVLAERRRQHELHGDQSHLPMGTGIWHSYGEVIIHQQICDQRTKNGTLTFTDILSEEVAEALAETDPVKLRTELIQVAAVCVQIIEALDQRQEAS